MDDDNLTPEQQRLIERGMDALEAMADGWAAEINLPAMIENCVSVSRLNRNAPDDVRETFIGRQKAQIDAVIRQAYIEGAYRGYLAGKAIEKARKDSANG